MSSTCLPAFLLLLKVNYIILNYSLTRLPISSIQPGSLHNTRNHIYFFFHLLNPFLFIFICITTVIAFNLSFFIIRPNHYNLLSLILFIIKIYIKNIFYTFIPYSIFSNYYTRLLRHSPFCYTRSSFYFSVLYWILYAA